MRFYELDQKIKEYKNFKIVAEHITKNNINLNDFLNKILISLNENEEQPQQPGFFQRVKQNVSNMWNKFRGNPYSVESVTQILQKIYDFLSGNPEMQKKYGEEINSLANIVKSISSKENPAEDSSKPAEDSSKPAEDSSKPAEDSSKPSHAEPDAKVSEAYLKRLTYGKPLESIDSMPNKENYKIYANELALYPQQNEVENTKNKLMKNLKEKVAYIEKVGVSLSGGTKVDISKNPVWERNKNQYLNHETWALWDIGKQLYLSKNPSKSGDGYKLGNPITDENLQKDIVNRMVGWAVTGGLNIEGKKISSKDLITIGEKALSEKPLFDSPTPSSAPAT